MSAVVVIVQFDRATGCWAAAQESAESGLPHLAGNDAARGAAPLLQPPGRRGQSSGVYKARITPNWFQNNSRFWYRNDLRGKRKEFIVVTVAEGARRLAFDHAKLAAALSAALGKTRDSIEPDRLPFDRIDFVEGGDTVRFLVEGALWNCDLKTYQCTKLQGTDDSLGQDPASGPGDGFFGRRRRAGLGPARLPSDAGPSPDGKWTVFERGGNIFLRPLKEGRNGAKDEIQLSRDGSAAAAYGLMDWAPDSRTVVAFRIQPGEQKEVFLIQSSPPGGGRAVLHRRPYALPGDRFTRYELNVFDLEQQRQSKPRVDQVELGPGRPRLRWHRDGRHFSYEQVDRGHQRFRVVTVDSRTGESWIVIDERARTFIWTAHTEQVGLSRVNWLEKSDEIVYSSEHDGWRHLYLIDLLGGANPSRRVHTSHHSELTAVVKNQITKGRWVVRGIDHIDEENRQIWFHASGVNSDQDPYFIHYYRVNFDGAGLVALTQGNGSHSVQLSPDRKYLIDTYSRVDQAPLHELRRTCDGKLVCKLEGADISELLESGWQPLEPFVAKGRDGRTDIWGVICRPRDFDPNKKHPIIESIYAGPQGAFVPKTFFAQNRYPMLADLGFVVVQIDGMGTAHRSKAFHDVCWKNLKDAGLPDRILWLRAAAAKYPYLDVSRVGVYGNSAGGQNAVAALLFHPDFYKVGVASCGCHDNRLDKASWNEQWMGYMPPEKLWSNDPDNWYSQSSNIDNAHRLQGRLLLIVGELDANVPPESTMRLADALIKAGKDFELLVIPGGGHGMGGAYGQRRMQKFFVRHLLGVEPANRNATQ
jgi:dipeptidyl aminopeptidase/acylaminoacyl peptidase